MSMSYTFLLSRLTSTDTIKNCCEFGDQIPAAFFLPGEKLVVCAPLNSKGKTPRAFICTLMQDAREYACR